MSAIRTFISIINREKRWALTLSLLVVILFFLLPLGARERSSKANYLSGMVQRLTSGSYWTKALTSGIGVLLLAMAVMILVHYIGILLGSHPPSNNRRG
jgi:hypothetical protein